MNCKYKNIIDTQYLGERVGNHEIMSVTVIRLAVITKIVMWNKPTARRHKFCADKKGYICILIF